ncbi:MAG: UpxY family transcription antiterminator [Flavobacteriaceae bacterium]|nr:UpxY family transcription antiterminator [Flavobacteriaceae bacterium]
MSWHALQTKPRNEKKVARLLEILEITVYCPFITESHQWSDRKKKIERPLIPSYIFIKLDAHQYNLVFDVPGVVRYLFWLGKPAVVRDSEIEVMKTWLSDEIIDAKVEKLQPGDIFNVSEGPFKGKEGIVHEVNKNRVQLLLKEFGIKITITRKQ